MYAAAKKVMAEIGRIIERSKFTNATIEKISLIRLTVGGPPILPKHSKNQSRLKAGNQLRTPLLRVKSRLADRKYIVFAPANIPDEHTPWATIISNAPAKAQKEFTSRPAATKAMWLTEE